MRRYSLFLSLHLLAASSLLAQISDDTTRTVSGDSTRTEERVVGTIGGEYVNKEGWGGRLLMTFGLENIQATPVSWSFVRDPADRRLKFSMNPLFSAVGLVLFGLGGNAHSPGPWPLTVLSIGLFIPQVLPNLTVQLPVVSKHFYLAAGQRTDFYLFNRPARIYSEAFVGARLFGTERLPLMAEVRYVWPISRGFLENKKPYIGVGLSLGLVQ